MIVFLLLADDKRVGGYFVNKSSRKGMSACLWGILFFKIFPFSLSVAVFLFGVRRTLHHKYDSYFTTFVISWCHYLLSAHRWAVAVLSFPQSVQYFVSVKQACWEGVFQSRSNNRLTPLSYPYSWEFDCWNRYRSVLWSKERVFWLPSLPRKKECFPRPPGMTRKIKKGGGHGSPLWEVLMYYTPWEKEGGPGTPLSPFCGFHIAGFNRP